MAEFPIVFKGNAPTSGSLADFWRLTHVANKRRESSVSKEPFFRGAKGDYALRGVSYPSLDDLGSRFGIFMNQLADFLLDRLLVVCRWLCLSRSGFGHGR